MKLGSLSSALSVASFVLLSYSPSALAARFANQFTEFELPPQWQCSLEGSEWICQNTNQAKKHEAIIILAAKLKGDQDSLDQYQAYLKAPRAFTSTQGKPVKSEPRYSKTVMLNNQPWVDALHLDSEIPGFYTRYLATVKQDIGVLITYSISKNKYQDYVDVFDNLVKTLKVFRKAGSLVGRGALAGGDLPAANVNPDSVFAPNLQNTDGGTDGKAPPPAKQLPVVPMAIGGAAVAFFIWKKKRASG